MDLVPQRFPSSFGADSQQRENRSPFYPVRLFIFSAHGTEHWIASAVRGQYQSLAPGHPQVLKRTLVLPSLHPVRLSPTHSTLSSRPLQPLLHHNSSLPRYFRSALTSPARPNGTPPLVHRPTGLLACSRPLLISRTSRPLAHILLSDLKAHYNSPTSPPPPREETRRVSALTSSNTHLLFCLFLRDSPWALPTPQGAFAASFFSLYCRLFSCLVSPLSPLCVPAGALPHTCSTSTRTCIWARLAACLTLYRRLLEKPDTEQAYRRAAPRSHTSDSQ